MDIQDFRQRLKDQNFLFAIAASLVPGVTSETKFGYRQVLTVISDLWAGPTPIYLFPDDNGQSLEVVSDNIGDTNDIEIIGVLQSTGLEIQITVTLNGTTSVPLPNLNDWVAVNRAFNDTGTTYLGNITIRGTGAPNSNIFGYIPQGDEQTQQLSYMVAADKIAFVSQINTWLNKSAGQTASCTTKFLIRKPGKVFRTRFRYGLQRDGTSGDDLTVGVQPAYPPSTQIRVVSNPSVEVDLSGVYQIILVDISLLEQSFIDKVIAS